MKDELEVETKEGLPGLKRLRLARNWSQAALAHEVGVTLNTIWRIETGRQWPRRYLLDRLTQVFACTPDDLILPAPAPAQAPL